MPVLTCPRCGWQPDVGPIDAMTAALVTHIASQHSPSSG